MTLPLSRRDFLHATALAGAGVALDRPAAAHTPGDGAIAATEPPPSSQFVVHFEDGAIVSLKRVDDAFDTEYVQTDRRLGDAVVRYRHPNADWQTLDTAEWTGERADPGRNGRQHIWRIYDYPHIALMYHGMYRIAKHNPQIRTALNATDYLLRAYGTAVAMFTIPWEIERWSAYQTGGLLEVVPRDGVRRRFHALLDRGRLHFELESDRFAVQKPILLDDDLKEVRFEVESDRPDAHSVELRMSGLPGGSYTISAGTDAIASIELEGGRAAVVRLPISDAERPASFTIARFDRGAS